MAGKNNRTYYATHAVGFAPIGATGSYEPASGVQSVGINTNFSLDQVFQLGQLEIYENIENIPSVEMTIDKVLDGAPLLQHLATSDALGSGLISRYNNTTCMVALSIYDDDVENASGNPLAMCVMSGMYVNGINFDFPVDGNFSESITLVGNDKVWATGANIGSTLWNFIPTTYSSAGSPLNAQGVARRQEMNMIISRWPTEIPGISSSGTNNLLTGVDGRKHSVHMQRVQISTDLGRPELFELGTKGPYHRFVDSPVEVTCSIEVIEREFGDYINASSTADNLSNQRIIVRLATDNAMEINLGTKNKLSSITSSGGDTGGGNRTTTYNYSNFNTLLVTQAQDPIIKGGVYSFP